MTLNLLQCFLYINILLLGKSPNTFHEYTPPGSRENSGQLNSDLAALKTSITQNPGGFLAEVADIKKNTFLYFCDSSSQLYDFQLKQSDKYIPDDVINGLETLFEETNEDNYCAFDEAGEYFVCRKSDEYLIYKISNDNNGNPILMTFGGNKHLTTCGR